MVGARSRGRLTIGAIILAVTAAIVLALMLLTRSTNHPGSAAPARSASTSHAHLIFGMTPQQVRRLAGRPKTIRGGCWLYRPKDGIVGSLSIGQPDSQGRRFIDVLKLCFFGGVLSQSFTHFTKLSTGSRGFWTHGNPP